jgi:hypothetical protein
MVRFVKKFGWLMALMLGLRGAMGFALNGPFNEAYQQGGTLGNGGLANALSIGWGFDIGAPKNIGEEYRWNTPVLYYSFDQSFLDYFGSNGVRAVEQAFTIMNNLTNVDSYSRDLSEFPLESSRVNFEAQALHVLDMKSETLHILMEQLGLAEPDRWTWVLRNRALPPGAACPAFVYSVIKRNFDPITWEPSSYVNGALYSYNIFEYCAVPINRADAVEFLVDPLAIPFSAVASHGLDTAFDDAIETDLGFPRYGFFYTGLTRDDVGGLRYLYTTNNMNVESVPASSQELITNTTPTLLFGTNLALLAAQALTNDAATLGALFPGLVITSSTNFFTNVFTTNITATFVPASPWTPVGGFTLAFTTNVTVSIQTLFTHTFANAFTLQYINGQPAAVPLNDLFSFTNLSLAFIQNSTVLLTNPPWLPVGTFILATNTSTRAIVNRGVTGEFFILPTNACEVAILGVQLTNVVSITNVLLDVTNNALLTGSNTFTLNQPLEFIQSIVTRLTNHVLVVFPINCVGGTVALRQGIERISFVRHDFDSLLGQFFDPITNNYTINSVTNNRVVPERFRRVVTQPDILFSAADIVSAPFSFPIIVNTYVRPLFAPPYVDETHALPGLAGPGTIQPQMQITFQKVGPIFENQGPAFLSQTTGFFDFVLGSFDGTTNAPIVFPQGSSIMALINQVLMRITTTSFTGVAGTEFSGSIQAVGGQAPYTFSLAPGSNGLPPGLTLSPDGTISGTPLSNGTYQIVARMVDAGGRTVDQLITFVIGT